MGAPGPGMCTYDLVIYASVIMRQVIWICKRKCFEVGLGNMP